MWLFTVGLNKVITLEEAAVLAEEFALTHKIIFVSKSEPYVRGSIQKNPKTQTQHPKAASQSLKLERECYYCHKATRKRQIITPILASRDTCMYVHMCTCVCVHTYMHVYVCAYVLVHIYLYKQMYIRVCLCVYIYGCFVMFLTHLF